MPKVLEEHNFNIARKAGRNYVQSVTEISLKSIFCVITFCISLHGCNDEALVYYRDKFV